MNLSEIDFIQVVVRIRGKYHMVLLNEATKRMLPELIAGMEGRTRESGGGVMGSIIDHYAESKVGWGRG